MNKTRFKCVVAVHLVLIENAKVLLLRRQGTGFCDGMYGFPAGCIDGNESVTQAMLREAKEEIGVTIKPEWLSVASVMHRKKSEECWESIALFFTTTQYTGKIQNCEPDKCDDVRFFPINALPPNTIPYMAQGLINTINHIPFFEYGW